MDTDTKAKYYVRQNIVSKIGARDPLFNPKMRFRVMVEILNKKCDSLSPLNILNIY